MTVTNQNEWAFGPGRLINPNRPSVDLDANPVDLSDGDLDTLEREAAEIMQACRREWDRRIGIRTTRGIIRGAPWTRDGFVPGHHWIDHPYAELHDGAKDFVSKPYNLGTDDLADLLVVARRGWDVTITAARARWFPGHTLHIRLSKDERGRRG